MRSLHKILLLFAFLVSLSSCSEYGKVLKSKDIEYKAEFAKKLYDKGDYVKALPLFEELITYYRGTDKAEDVYYMHAFCNYKLEYYYLASFYFENFAKNFPNSQFAEECSFMAAYCYYNNSPKASLDQTETQNAISALNLFINKYPKSNLVDSSNVLIDQLRGKLEDKAYNDSYLYYKTRNYKSAVIAFKYLMRDYPGTKYQEKASYYIVKSSYLLASNSIESKVKERFEKTIEEYLAYVDKFPNGKYLKELESIYAKSRKRLENLSELAE